MTPQKIKHNRIVREGNSACYTTGVTSITRPIWMVFLALLVFAFGSRVFRLNVPEKYYFDEVYHAVTAKLILHNDPRAYEWWNPEPEPNTAVDWLHPPLAKLTQAASMAVFGENSFGWRLSSAVFGTATVALIFFTALELGFSPKTATLAAGLYSLDGLALTTSRIAMNDAHVTFFFLLAIWCYTRWKKMPTDIRAYLTAVSIGLAVASKWSGIFVLAAIGLDQVRLLLTHRKEFTKSFARLLALAASIVIVVPSIYLLSYSQMFAQGKTWKHFRELHRQIWWYQTHLDATHPYQSTPLEWVLNLRPVYVHADFADPTSLQNIYMQGNPIIFWAGAIAVLWTFGDAAASFRKKENDALLVLLTAYGITWIPWLFSPRIMFFYHYLPALPFLSILLAHQLTSAAKQSLLGKRASIILVIAAAMAFWAFFPNWTALPVPLSWGKIFFMLPRWR